jgi:hypothetical protein
VVANRCLRLARAAQEEKDLCANPAVTNVTACAAKYPTAMSVPTCVDDEDAATPACTGFADGGPTAANCPTGCTFLAAVDDPLTGTSADDAAPDAWVTGLTLAPKSWTFMTATVPAGVDMYHAKYSVRTACVAPPRSWHSLFEKQQLNMDGVCSSRSRNTMALSPRLMQKTRWRRTSPSRSSW